MNLLTRQRPPLSRDEAFGLKTWVRLNVSVGDRFDWKRVPREEQTDLAALIRKAATETDMVDWGKLTKSERTTAERLLALGAGEPADYFEAQRKEADIMRQFAELGVKSRRRNPLKRQQVADVFQIFHAKLASGHLHLTHVGLLSYILMVLQSGQPLSPMQRIEGEGDNAALVIDQSWGLVPSNIDGWDGFTRWRQQLDWLAKTHWVEIDKRGPKWRITLGRKMLVALHHGEKA